MSGTILCLCLCAGVLLLGCASPPEVEELPDDEHGIEQIGEEVPAEGDGPAPADPVDALPFTALRVRDVRGGELTIELPAAPDAVAAMLLDFEGADGHRAWARRHTLVSKDERDVVARWEMEGKSGVEPVVELAFRRDTLDDGTLRIRFRLTKTDFGLAAFFGDYRIRTIEGGSSLSQRVFIDSGLWIANASIEEIEAGLREDSKRLRDWLGERITSTSSESASSPGLR